MLAQPVSALAISSLLVSIAGDAAAQSAPPPAEPAPPPATAPAQPPPPPPPGAYQPPPAYGAPDDPFAHHRGLMVGFGLGLTSVSCNNCDSSTEAGFDFQLGGFITPVLALMWDYGGYVDSQDIGTFVLASHTAAAQFWVAPKIWVRGGAGLSQAYLSTDLGDDSEYGLAIAAAAGYEVMESQNFVIDLSARAALLDFDRLTQRLEMVSAIVGARWR
jgi:hypothetical protein